MREIVEERDEMRMRGGLRGWEDERMVQDSTPQEQL